MLTSLTPDETHNRNLLNAAKKTTLHLPRGRSQKRQQLSKVLDLGTAVSHFDCVRSLVETIHGPSSLTCHLFASFPSAWGPGVVSRNPHLFAMGFQPGYPVTCLGSFEEDNCCVPTSVGHNFLVQAARMIAARDLEVRARYLDGRQQLGVPMSVASVAEGQEKQVLKLRCMCSQLRDSAETF